MNDRKTEAPPDIARGDWWQLKSGNRIEVRSIRFSEEDGKHIATVRWLNHNNVMSHGSFDVVASLITSTGKRIKK